MHSVVGKGKPKTGSIIAQSACGIDFFPFYYQVAGGGGGRHFIRHLINILQETWFTLPVTETALRAMPTRLAATVCKVSALT